MRISCVWYVFLLVSSSSLHLVWRDMHGTHQTPKSCIKDLLASCNIISFVSRSSPDTSRYTESIALDLHSALILPISNYLPLNNFRVQFLISQHFTLNKNRKLNCAFFRLRNRYYFLQKKNKRCSNFFKHEGKKTITHNNIWT